MVANSNYSYLIKQFGEDTVNSRYKMICEMLLNYIDQEGLTDLVVVSEELVSQAVTDYFVDIDRLKTFHEIDLVNAIKIHSYLAYWLLRRKPLQIIGSSDQKDLQFVNEEMVSSLLEAFLFQEPTDVSIVRDQKENFTAFVQTLRYYLKYRAVNPQSIELMLQAFLGGRAYQYSVDYQV